jgi:structural maintenance of chromosome 3 (chondroitin sulfate proteoglycan 6)
MFSVSVGITVMPLNRLSAREESYPGGDLMMSDVLPMIDQLEFNEKYRKAILQVFGKTLVARSLNVASQYARKYSLDAVTLDGL